MPRDILGLLRTLQFLVAFTLALAFAIPAFAQNVGPNNIGAGTYGPPFTSQGSHWISGGGLPPAADAGCGTGATVVGTDAAFHVTTGTGTSPGTACIVTFSVAWAQRPTCNGMAEINAASFKITPTTVTIQSVVDGQRYHVQCVGRAGG